MTHNALFHQMRKLLEILFGGLAAITGFFIISSGAVPTIAVKYTLALAGTMHFANGLHGLVKYELENRKKPI